VTNALALVHVDWLSVFEVSRNITYLSILVLSQIYLLTSPLAEKSLYQFVLDFNLVYREGNEVP